MSLALCFLSNISACEEGWKLLPKSASPDQQKCYKWFEEARAQKIKAQSAQNLCYENSAKLPLPKDDQEMQNLDTAITKLGISYKETCKYQSPSKITPTLFSNTPRSQT